MSDQPTYAESLRRVQQALERIVAALKEHDALACENCKTYEAERELRGVRA